MGLEDFKYRAKFSQNILISRNINDSDIGDDGFHIAKAAINKSKKEINSLFPDHLNLEKNSDLIGIYFDAAVINHFNKHGQGIGTDTALSLKDLFIHKPNNVEHNEKHIIGHTVNAFFSEHGQGGSFLTDEDVKGRTDKFDLSLASVFYPKIDPDFAQIVLRSTIEEDALFHFISASWEVAFSEYHIALGSNDLEDAEIITDPKQIKYYSKFLKTKGGKGVDDDGVIVNQLIIGEALPIGIGFTTNPAGEVKGLSLKDPIKIKKKRKKRKKKEKAVANDKNISQSLEKPVNSDKALYNSIMDKNQIDSDAVVNEIRDILSKGKSQEEMKASIQAAIKGAVEDCNNDYVQALNEEKEKAEKAEKALASLQEKFDTLESNLKESTDKLEKLESQEQERVAIATLNDRMGKIDDKYELSDEARKEIMADVKPLNNEEFESYEGKLSVLLPSKEDLAKASEDQKKEMEQKVKEEIAKASASPDDKEDKENKNDDETSLDEALETAKASNAAVSTSKTDENEDLSTKFEKAFQGEGKIEIKV